MSDKPTVDVVRWYTRARKFPQLIGRTPDGARLWGGPYTITQAVGAGLTMFVGLNTMWLWASFGFIGNLLVLGAVTYAVVFALGQIPVGSRSPLSVLTGTYRAIAAPGYGRLAGRPVRIRRPHLLQHTVVIRHEPLVAHSRQAAPVAPGAGRPGPAVVVRRHITDLSAPQTRPVSAPCIEARQADQRSELQPAGAPLSGVQSLLASAGRPSIPVHARPRSETS